MLSTAIRRSGLVRLFNRDRANEEVIRKRSYTPSLLNLHRRGMLSRWTLNTLRNNGVSSLKELLELDYREFKRMKRIGPKGVSEIRLIRGEFGHLSK